MTTKTSGTTKAAESRWKCVCAYDGGCFQGWQSQPSGQTVQDTIERALEKIFHRKIRIHGSSRTDTGVHARGMVFHFDARWRAAPERLELALRRLLPSSIRVAPITRAPPDFHARFSATGKLYRYYLYEGWPDPFTINYCWPQSRELSVERMQAAAAVLTGKHDFTAFAAYPGRDWETPVRDLRRLDVRRTGKRIIITAEADGFLYKMVRSLVGALVDTGTGKLTVRQVREILRSRKRTALVATAPPQGLFLEKVFYHQTKQRNTNALRPTRARRGAQQRFQTDLPPARTRH